MDAADRAEGRVVRGFRSPGVGIALSIVAAIYLAGVWLDAVTNHATARRVPRPLVYFTQIAGLFPKAAVRAIDYRAEGWDCRKKEWFEVDVRPFFPIEADDKESRFHRAMFFYNEHRQTMQALEDYVMKNVNRTAIDRAAAGKGGGELIGGVRFLSLRIPFGEPGEAQRYERKPLASYPEEMRKNWYWTPQSKREDRCAKIGP